MFLVEDALKGPDGPAVSAAWIRFHPGTGFASLWGGGTLPEWRRQGIYSALLAHRARLAKERGYEFLRVDASEDSRPILQKLGLHGVTVTTPYSNGHPDLTSGTTHARLYVACIMALKIASRFRRLLQRPGSIDLGPYETAHPAGRRGGGIGRRP